MNNEITIVQEANQELAKQTKDPATIRALMATTFKGFKSEQLVRQACLEALLNGYTFQDLVQKKVYAIPFGDAYSLVQSIDDVRATAMASGQIGKSAPVFEENADGSVKSCTVTVKRKVGDTIGDYTATVYFAEYYKAGRTYNGKYVPSMWDTKPRTMIAKVTEMHALRMAFPEKLSKAYIEDEFREEGIGSRMADAKRESDSIKMKNIQKNDEEKSIEKDIDSQDDENANSDKTGGKE